MICYLWGYWCSGLWNSPLYCLGAAPASMCYHSPLFVFELLSVANYTEQVTLQQLFKKASKQCTSPGIATLTPSLCLFPDAPKPKLSCNDPPSTSADQHLWSMKCKTYLMPLLRHLPHYSKMILMFTHCQPQLGQMTSPALRFLCTHLSLPLSTMHILQLETRKNFW